MTTGNYCGIDVWLKLADGGRIAVDTRHAKLDVAVSDLGVEETVAEAQGLARRMSLQRLPDRPEETRVAFDLKVPVRKEGDTRLFVRVQQVDGHRAWSSPIYLFR